MMVVFWTGARQVYERCRRLGLCRSQRDFSSRLLGRGPHYLRLVSNRRAFISEKTNRTLRRRIAEARSTVAPQVVREIDLILSEIDRAEEMACWLRRA
ncbi:MAG: hypothetical protein KF777_24895 [Planctomycetaceae bacterium]|nr:hypothetical protein [Planctomycetaceae bacterium]